MNNICFSRAFKEFYEINIEPCLHICTTQLTMNVRNLDVVNVFVTEAMMSEGEQEVIVTALQEQQKNGL